MVKKEPKNIADFLLEVGALKRLPRMGWLNAGIKDPETIAEHSMRAAIIAWILSDMEKTDSERTVKMALFHDIHETRSGDTTTVTKIYLKNYREAEARAIVDISKNSLRKRQTSTAASWWNFSSPGQSRQK